MRDVSRSSRSVVRVAMDACRVRRVLSRGTKRWQRTAKSQGPGAATVASIPAGLCWRGNGDNKRRSPGRLRISRKAVARGKPGCPGRTCQTRVHSLLLQPHTVACGCRRRPAFPAPSLQERAKKDAKPGRNRAAGLRAVVLPALWDARLVQATCWALSRAGRRASIHRNLLPSARFPLRNSPLVT